MKRSTFLGLIIFMFLVGCAGMPTVETTVSPNVKPADILRRRVAVLTGEQSGAAVFLSDVISTELLGLGFRIVERSRLATLLQEHKLSLSGLLEKEDYLQLGKLTNIGAIFLVSGILTDSGNIKAVNVRLVDLSTGDLLMSTTYSQPLPDLSNYVGHQSINESAKEISMSIFRRLNSSINL